MFDVFPDERYDIFSTGFCRFIKHEYWFFGLVIKHTDCRLESDRFVVFIFLVLDNDDLFPSLVCRVPAHEMMHIVDDGVEMGDTVNVSVDDKWSDDVEYVPLVECVDDIHAHTASRQRIQDNWLVFLGCGLLGHRVDILFVYAIVEKTNHCFVNERYCSQLIEEPRYCREEH